VTFECNEQVRKIVLNFNSIEDRLSVDAWSHLEDVLQELYLGDCRLQSLPSGMFDSMHQLRYLHLWNNQITVIPSQFFQVGLILKRCVVCIITNHQPPFLFHRTTDIIAVPVLREFVTYVVQHMRRFY